MTLNSACILVLVGTCWKPGLPGRLYWRCASLTLLFMRPGFPSALTFAARLSRTGGGDPYIVSVAVFVTELLKLFICLSVRLRVSSCVLSARG